jgi:hypothetical protein
VGRGILLKAHVIGRSRTVLAEEEGVERKSWSSRRSPEESDKRTQNVLVGTSYKIMIMWMFET